MCVFLNVDVNFGGVRRVVNFIYLILNGIRSSVLRSVGLRMYSVNMNVEKIKLVYLEGGDFIKIIMDGVIGNCF